MTKVKQSTCWKCSSLKPKDCLYYCEACLKVRSSKARKIHWDLSNDVQTQAHAVEIFRKAREILPECRNWRDALNKASDLIVDKYYPLPA